MKKLMIALAAVAVAAVSNAASMDWSFNETQFMGAHPTMNFGAADLTGMTLYVFEANTWAALEGAEGYASTALEKALDSHTFVAADVTEANVGTPGYSKQWVATGKGSGEEIVAGGKYDAMFVIVSADGTSYEALAGMLQGDGYEGAASPSPASFTVGYTEDKAFKTANFSQFTDVAPEPTSGLLLLIGVAGLALRRRRA